MFINAEVDYAGRAKHLARCEFALQLDPAGISKKALIYYLEMRLWERLDGCRSSRNGYPPGRVGSRSLVLISASNEPDRIKANGFSWERQVRCSPPLCELPLAALRSPHEQRRTD